MAARAADADKRRPYGGFRQRLVCRRSWERQAAAELRSHRASRSFSERTRQPRLLRRLKLVAGESRTSPTLAKTTPRSLSRKGRRSQSRSQIKRRQDSSTDRRTGRNQGQAGYSAGIHQGRLRQRSSRQICGRARRGVGETAGCPLRAFASRASCKNFLRTT